MTRLTNEQIDEAGLPDWRKLAQALHASYAVDDLEQAGRFVTALAGAGVDPTVCVATGLVSVSLCTREDGRWVTERDVEAARTVSALARELGLSPQPQAVTQLELALDTAHEESVAPFWAALLTGDATNRVHDSVFDPADRVPAVWFQSTDDDPGARADSDPVRGPEQRWHFDLWLAPEVADGRIAAAVEAGGRIVYDEQTPTFTILADPDGNRVCVCTSLGR